MKNYLNKIKYIEESHTFFFIYIKKMFDQNGNKYLELQAFVRHYFK